MRCIVRFTDAKEEALQYLKEIDKVQVGVYEIEHGDRASKLMIPRDVEDKLIDSGWELFVRVKEKDEHVDLFYKQINDHVSSIYVIVLEPEEMVLVELKGDQEKIIDTEIREHGLPHREILDIS